MMNSKQLGNLGEKIAQEYLRKKKYKILARNFKNKWGEIDIVALPPHQKFWCGGKKKKKIVFFEIKTLRQAQGKPFLPEDAINRKKKRQLLKMAQIYLSCHGISFGTPHQIDVLAIELGGKVGKPKIRHIENAIEDNY